MIKACNIQNIAVNLAKIQGKLYLFLHLEYTGKDFEVRCPMAAEPFAPAPGGCGQAAVSALGHRDGPVRVRLPRSPGETSGSVADSYQRPVGGGTDGGADGGANRLRWPEAAADAAQRSGHPTDRPGAPGVSGHGRVRPGGLGVAQEKQYADRKASPGTVGSLGMPWSW